jgi:outer membrane protein assembly factor BamB
VLAPAPTSSISYGHGTLIGGDPASYASNVFYTRVCFYDCTGDAAADDAIRYVQVGSSGSSSRASGPLTSHALTLTDALVFMQNNTVHYIQAQAGTFNDERWTAAVPAADGASPLLPAVGAVLVPLAGRAGFVALDADSGAIAWTSSPAVPSLLFPASTVLADAVVDAAAGRLYQLACMRGNSLSVVTVKLVSGATTASPGIYTDCTNYTSLTFSGGLLYATGVRDAFFTDKGVFVPSVGFALVIDPNDPGGSSASIPPGSIVKYENETLSALACSASFCAATLRPSGDVVVLDTPAAGSAGAQLNLHERVRARTGAAVGDVAPVVDANGAIYVSSRAGDVFALNPVTGVAIASARLALSAKQPDHVVELALTQGLLLVTTSLPLVFAVGSTPAAPAAAAAPAALPAAGVAAVSVAATLAAAGAAAGALWYSKVLQLRWGNGGEARPLLAS